MEAVRSRFDKVRGILFKEQTKILSAAFSLMILTLLTKISGMLYTVLLAQKFGASRPLDILNAANTIPDMVTTVLLFGSISGSIIPVLIKAKQNETQEDFIKFFNTLLNLSLTVFLFITVIIVIFSNTLVEQAVISKIINPEVPFSAEEIQKIGDLMRVLMFPQIILGVSAFVSSALNVYDRFIVPSLAPLFYNIGRIIGVLFFVDLIGTDINGVAIGDVNGVVMGTYIGSLLHLLIQLPLLFHIGLNYKLIINLKNQYISSVLKLSLPRVVSLAGESINQFVSQIIAISLQIGSLSAFNFATSLISIPLTLFGASFAIASFPAFSKHYEKGEHVEFSKLFRKVINQIFFLAVPVTATLLILRLPLTRLFYGILGGEFNWEDTTQVSWIIFFFSLGLSFETLRSFLYRIFYSLHDSTRPFISSIIVMIIGIAMSLMLTNYFSHYYKYDVNEVLGHVRIVDIDFDRNGDFPWIEKFEFAPEINLLPGFSLEKLTTREKGDSAVGGLALSASIVFTLEFILLMIFLARKKFINNMKQIGVDFLKKIFAGFMMMIFLYTIYQSWESILSTSKTINLLLLSGLTIFSSTMFYMWISYVIRVNEVDLIMDYGSVIFKRLESRFKFLSIVRKVLQ